MPIDVARCKSLLTNILVEIEVDGAAAIDRFENLRAVDAKKREVLMILQEGGARSLVEQIQSDKDFIEKSRRVRLEALAHYCRTAITFFDAGVGTGKRVLVRAPDLTKLTSILPDLEPVIQARWLEAQKCQQARAYLAAVILMGSVLEALLLARASMSPGDAYRSKAAPRDRSGKNHPIHEWSLHALIDVAVECGWLKVDRGKFGHALRESRNVVHPWEHARSRANFDEATCTTSWHVLKASVNDLLASVP